MTVSTPWQEPSPRTRSSRTMSFPARERNEWEDAASYSPQTRKSAITACESYGFTTPPLGANPGDDTFQDRPVVIVEVLSESTRRTEQDEKRIAYYSRQNLTREDTCILLTNNSHAIPRPIADLHDTFDVFARYRSPNSRIA